MPTTEVLILAMTKMLSGICTAGFTTEPAPTTGLRWVRPVRDFSCVLPGDMTNTEGRLIQCGDVVELRLLEPRPDAPHVEDWLVDFVHHRPCCVRRLEGEKRAAFFPRYLDQAPHEVLFEHKRSLCLVQPAWVEAIFRHDPVSGKYQTRMRVELPGEVQHPHAIGKKGLPVTDLKWRALGREWLAAEGRNFLHLDHEALLDYLNASALYLTMGLSRHWQGQYWPLVHAIHAVPDYDATINLELL